MDFKKYSSIDNCYAKQVENIKRSKNYQSYLEWNVTEKCDGANFSIWLDGNEVKYAKRSQFVGANGIFYNFQNAVKHIDTDKLYKLLREKFDNATEFIIYGELCGGYYTGMPLIPNSKKVQKRVEYSNKNEFIVFDIVAGDTWITHQEVINICNSVGINVVPIIFTGSLAECIEWSQNHNADLSKLWCTFGMPKETPNNIREGHVIKPNCHLSIFEDRMILKDKNDKFKESKELKETKPKTQISLNVNKILDVARSMITTNRFYSVTSKFGEYTIKDFQHLMNDMVNDILDELKKDNSNYNDLLSEEVNLIPKYLLRDVASFIGKNKKELF